MRVTRWTIYLFREIVAWPPYWIEPEDPWRPRLEGAEFDEAPLVDSIGWAMRRSAARSSPCAKSVPLREELDERFDEKLHELAERGVRAGIGVMVGRLRRGLKDLSTLT